MPDGARTQANRRMAVASPLGDDVLLLRSFTGTEALGRPFEITLDLVSEKRDLAPGDIIGQNLTIAVQCPAGQTRYFNGLVSRFSFVGITGSLASYRATLVPWFWFLTQMATCRIFQDKSVPDIIKQVLTDRGFSEIEDRLSNSYQAWEYCVQYRETDFNFLSRLMEQEGIYYFFLHEDGKHKLVLIDSTPSHQESEGYAIATFRTESEADLEHEVVTSLSVDHAQQPSVVAMRDYNFKTFSVPTGAVQREHGGIDDTHEVFDYPGEVETDADAAAYAKARAQELAAATEIVNADSTSWGLLCGAKVTLQDHPLESQNRELLLTAIQYRGENDAFESQGGSGGGGGQGAAAFTCAFTAIPADRNFRSPRVTPKPVIPGPQTAFVTTKEGEEIWTDEYGRVKVIFFWDRTSKPDELSSCWIRVSQAYAGKGWGAMCVPRKGEEVIVEFLEGDPDRPIITGRVYNNESKPAYALPDMATMSYLKSSSSKGGEGFNEIRFEDKAGEEQVFLHAQKNMDIQVLNDRFETIGHDRNLEVVNDKKELVKNDRHEVVKNNHHEDVGKEFHLTVGDKMAIEVKTERSTTVGEKVTDVFKADHIEETTGDYSLKAKNVVIEAETKLTLKVGQSHIVIEGSEITIKSGTVKIEGTTKLEAKGLETAIEGTTKLEAKGLEVSIKADVKVGVEGAVAELKGSGMTTVKGGVVMIN